MRVGGWSPLSDMKMKSPSCLLKVACRWLGLGFGFGFGFGLGLGFVLNEGRLQVGEPGGDGRDPARAGEAAVVASEAAAARDRGGGGVGEEGGLDRVVEPG